MKNLKAWLIYSEKSIERNKRYIEIYFEECALRNIHLELLYEEKISMGIVDNHLSLLYDNQKIPLPDFVICRTIYPLLTRHLELMGLKVYNNYKIADICNDKQKTLLAVNKLGVPVVNTSFNKAGHMSYIDGYPKVIKPANGHGGQQVSIVNDIDELKEKEEIINADYMVQDIAYRGKDLRVYVVGKQIIAGMLRESRSDFRANYSLGGKATVYHLSGHEIKLIQKIINAFDFGLVGIDFMFVNHSKLVFNEIEDVVGAKMLYQHTDINIASLYLDFMIDDIRKN